MNPETPQNNYAELPEVHPDQQALIEVPPAYKKDTADSLGSAAAKRLVGEPQRGVVEVPPPANPTRAINRGLGWTDASKERQ